MTPDLIKKVEGLDRAALRVRKYVRKWVSPQNGLSYSFNEWEVRRGPKLVGRFAFRSEALALLRALEARERGDG